MVEAKERELFTTVTVFGLTFFLARALCQVLPRGLGYSVLAAALTMLATFVIGLGVGYAFYTFGIPSRQPDANHHVGFAFIGVAMGVLASPFIVWFYRRQPALTHPHRPSRSAAAR